jgi:hypothetical protein
MNFQEVAYILNASSEDSFKMRGAVNAPTVWKLKTSWCRGRTPRLQAVSLAKAI